MKFEDLYYRLPKQLTDSCSKCEQDPLYHPEGSIENHTRMVFDYALKNYSEDTELLVCAIFHDLGKLNTQKISKRNDGSIRISNIGHENYAIDYIEKYFDLFSDITTNKEKIAEICKNHMKAHLYIEKKMTKPAKRKAFEELKYFNDTINFAMCDTNGRG
jgi:hypothetical protein